MMCRNQKTGFTLLEMLIAVTLVVLIVSMVYGTYRATLQTVQPAREKGVLTRQACTLFTGMARQISGLYPFAAPSAPAVRQTENRMIQPAGPACLIGDSRQQQGQILSLLTTTGIDAGDGENGLLRVEYRFDAAAGVLSYRQQRWLPTGEPTPDGGGDRPLAHHIKSIQLEFFDGKTWFDYWHNTEVPAAVRIQVDFQGKSSVPLRREILVPVPCWHPKEIHG